MPNNQNFFQALWKYKGFRISCFLILALIMIFGAGFLILTRSLSKSDITSPISAHYHFRMQILIDGEQVDFSESRFQQPYDKNSCNALLTDQPIHFHDGNSQFTHIHWRGITGGQVLKYYGLNKIGGLDQYLGFRLDNLPEIKPVKIHGNLLPGPKSEDKVYVYTGNQSGYSQRSEDDFLNKDLEEFFSGSQVNAGGINVYAENSQGHTEEELKKLNNVVGNVVIFVQKDEPSEGDLKKAFNNLGPLPMSVCGG